MQSKSEIYTNEIIGHRKIVEWLRLQYNNDNLSHSYLFIGQKNLGKTTVAKKFAQFIFCENKGTGDGLAACGKCKNCILFEKNQHPDLYFLEKEKNKKHISIEQINKLQKDLSLKSASGNYKIAIISEANYFNKEAANRLLKILEEPYKKTIFILTARSLQEVLPTIYSRCQVYRFYPLPSKFLDDYLKLIISDSKKREKIITLSAGCPGKIINFLHNPDELEKQEFFVRTALDLFKGNFLANNELIQKQIKHFSYNERFDNLKDLLNILLVIIGDIFYVKNNLYDNLLLSNYEKEIKEIAVNFSNKKLSYLNYQIIKFFKNAPYNPDLNIFVNKLNLTLSSNI